MDEYSMDFCSTQKGKLKWRGYRNGKVIKTKNFPRISATAHDIRNPSPELKEVMMSIEEEFNKNYIACYGTDKSPVLMMFPSKYAETRTASKFFDDIADFRLRRWMDFLGDNADWSDITDELLMDYVGYLETEDIANNTIRAYANGLKKALDDAKRRGYVFPSKSYWATLKRSISDSVSVYLTMDEIKLLQTVQLEPKLDAVRVKFLIGVYTGARYSDFSKLDKADIVDGWVRYVSEKTNTLTHVRLHPSLPALLERYNDDVNIMQMNRAMPEIAERAGITSETSIVRGDKKIKGKKCMFVKSHTARRTFATNVYLSGEYDAFEISKFLGHKSVDTTSKYIKCGVRSKLDGVWSFFK